MMDSQENALQEAQTVQENQVEQPAAEAAEPVAAPEVEQPAADEQPAEAPAEPAQPEEPAEEQPAEEPQPAEEAPAEKQRKTFANKEEVLREIKEVAAAEEIPAREETDYLKTTFYRLLNAEREALHKAYLDSGGDPEAYQLPIDPAEEEFKAQFGIIKEKRAKHFQMLEGEKQENLKKKLNIIEQIKQMATSPEEANKSYQAFKALQQQWRELKAVPAESARELWRNYQHQVEQFYDLLKLNSEAREYDFKKNLEIKTKLCEAAENLANEEDVISAFHQLQELHQQYRETGPVAKEIREEIWTRFKTASTAVNKRYQQHFEGLRAQEEENLAKKTALCEQAEAIVKEENKGNADWDRHTQALLDLQKEWKAIGFAPQKMNVKIFERFRVACDEFFAKKAEHFKQLKAQYAENAEKKRALIEKAQALQDSTEWKSTGDKLIALQKEWKTIGMVPHKLGDQLWNDFLAACNKFFEARNQATSGARNEERENLEKKKNIVEQLKALVENVTEEGKEQAQALIQQYSEVGHVPYKEKDNIYKAYHEVLGEIYKAYDLSPARRRLDNFKSSLKNVAKRGEDALDNERTRLMKRYEQMKQEIQTYENNLGFLNASSKKGNTLIDEMNKKVQKLKDEVNLVREKIKAIDASNASEEE